MGRYSTNSHSSSDSDSRNNNNNSSNNSSNKNNKNRNIYNNCNNKDSVPRAVGKFNKLFSKIIFFPIFFPTQAKFNPDTDLLGIWKAMEKLVDSGRCRAIGASNFNSEQLERVSAVARRPIAVNQVGIFYL